MSFEENVGQAAGRVRYQSRGLGYGLFLTSSGAVLVLSAGRPVAGEREGRAEGRERGAPRTAAVVQMTVVGGTVDPQVSGMNRLPGTSHYFIGNDPRRWRRDVPHFARVRYREVYPGVDLEYYSTRGGRLEYDFLVAPGADPSRIRLRFEGARGIRLDAEGDLVVPLGEGSLEQHAPVLYQRVEGVQRPVAGKYTVDQEGEVGFEVGDYDPTRLLTIDPVLEYSTYLGGNSFDIGEGIAVDGSGSVYVTGETGSTDFPTLNPYQTDLGTTDVFVTKLSPSGSSLVYSTYLGGSGFESSRQIAVDGAGSAYVAGDTNSTDFPTLNPYQTLNGPSDAFVTKLSPSGSSLVYSTYLGGSSFDNAEGLAVDGSGSVYVTGNTASTDFPTLNPFQTDQGEQDAFVTKLSASGSSLVYSTYLGGSGRDTARDVAVDASGSAYVSGETDSTDYPTLNPYQTDQGARDIFVTKLSPSGSSLAYSTYLGGTAAEVSGESFAVDGSGSAYVTGWTFSTDFPTVNPYQMPQGGVDAFVAKLSPSGSSLVYSTYLGGSSHENGQAIAVDGSGSAIVVGSTLSTDFPTLNPIQTDQPDWDVFVARLSPSGSSLVYSTYLGGSRQENVYGGIALDGSGNVFLTGRTDSSDFPTLNAYQVSAAVNGDAFVAKLAQSPAPTRFYTVAPCRAVDTRNPAGPLGGPALVCSPSPLARTFTLAGICGIPATARAISSNVAVTQPTAAGNLRLFAAASSTPTVSSLNYAAGATRGNNGIVRLGTGGLSVTCHQASGTAHVILDVNGYFE